MESIKNGTILLRKVESKDTIVDLLTMQLTSNELTFVFSKKHSYTSQIAITICSTMGVEEDYLLHTYWQVFTRCVDLYRLQYFMINICSSETQRQISIKIFAAESRIHYPIS